MTRIPWETPTVTAPAIDPADVRLLLDYLYEQETSPENLAVVFAWQRLNRAVPVPASPTPTEEGQR